jgi:hypothetical protein
MEKELKRMEINPATTVLRETCISRIEFIENKPVVNVDQWVSNSEGGDVRYE